MGRSNRRYFAAQSALAWKPLNLTLAHIHPRPGAKLPFDDEVARYLTLTSRWLPAAARGFASESALSSFIPVPAGQRTAVVLCDMRGKSLSSEELAGWIERRRDGGTGRLVLAIGPADGWSTTMREKADLCLSLSAMTFPHAMARLMLAEQIYRAATIIGRHPYHTGH